MRKVISFEIKKCLSSGTEGRFKSVLKALRLLCTLMSVTKF